jgi:hypothetical protein
VGDARAAQSVHRTTADEPDQTGCHAGPPIHFDRPPCRNPKVSSSSLSAVGHREVRLNSRRVETEARWQRIFSNTLVER